MAFFSLSSRIDLLSAEANSRDLQAGFQAKLSDVFHTATK